MLMKRPQFVFSALLLAGLVPVLLPMNTWVGTLASSLAVQVALAYGVIALLCLLFRLWYPVVTGALSAGLIMLLLPSFSATPLEAPAQGTVLKVAHYNVLVSNKGYDSIIQSVKTEQPDVISFQEVSHGWARHLETQLKKDYPYYYLQPDTWVWGIALFSKLPLEDVALIEMQGVPNLTASVCVAGQPVHVIASHAPNPLFWEHGRRNRHLRDIAQHLAGVSGPKIAMGDYNTVPWDNNLLSLCKTGGVQDGRKTLCATYPSGLPFARIPIDYILHSPDIHCHSFRVLNNVSSDHCGIVGEYLIGL